MTFHDEIVKLQERVAALEAILGQVPEAAPESVEPAAYTKEYLDTLSVDQIGDLYKAGKIDAGQLGEAVTRKVFPQGVPAELRDELGHEPNPEPQAHEVEAEHDGPTIEGEPVEVEPVDAEAVDTHADEIEDAANGHGQGEPVVEAETAATAVEDAGLES